MADDKNGGKGTGTGSAGNKTTIRESVRDSTEFTERPSRKGILDVTNTFSPPPPRKKDGDGEGS